MVGEIIGSGIPERMPGDSKSYKAKQRGYKRMIRIKKNVNVLKTLKENGYSSYTLRKKRIFGEARIQRMREGKVPSMRELNMICELTGKTLADFVEFIPDRA